MWIEFWTATSTHIFTPIWYGAKQERPTAKDRKTHSTEAVSVAEIQRAAAIIRRGGLVAFPTETVYGLGANALDANAVAKIYAVKGRPSSSPLIVHVTDSEMAQAVVSEWPPIALVLAQRFWPGPLTLVLPKSSSIPDGATANLPSVGVRVPAHPVALALIREAGLPIAAPSANRFMGISPTAAAHVGMSLPQGVDMVLDGGSSNIGIESTVVSLLGSEPVVLRPGHITQDDLQEATGLSWPFEVKASSELEPHLSPGLHQRHYAPRTPFFLLSHDGHQPSGNGKVLSLPQTPQAYAAALYAALHEADHEGLDWIAVLEPPAEPGWLAIRDRLSRAAKRYEGGES